MLNEQTKRQILDVLRTEFPLGEEIHMARVGKFLHDHEMGPEAYQLKKMKQLLSSLSEIMTLRERVMNGVPQTIIVLHEYREPNEAAQGAAESEKPQLPQVEQKVKPETKPKAENNKKEEYPKKIQDFAFLPNKVIEFLEKLASATSMEGRSAREVLAEAYDRAIEDHTMEVGKNRIVFFTGVYTGEQEPLYAGFSPNRIPTAQKWALTYIGTQNARLLENSEKKQKKDKTDRQEKPEKPEKSDKTDKMNKPEKTDKSDTANKPETPDAPAKKAQETAGTKTDISQEMLLPVKTVNYIYQYAGNAELNGRTAMEILEQAYKRARREKQVNEKEDALYFPLYIHDQENKSLYAVCRPNRFPNQQKWALTYVGRIGNPRGESDARRQKAETAPAQEKKEYIPPETLEEFAALPVVTVSRLDELAVKPLPDGKNAQEILRDSYRQAVQEGSLYIEGPRASFFTGLYTEKGDPLHAGFARNRFAEEPTWVLNFIGSDTFNPNLPEEQRRIVPGKKLEAFAYLGNWDAVLQELADMALPEKWDFDFAPVKNRYILRQYLCYTFYRLQNEGKICISAAGNFAAFNTGLVNRMYEDIYACFVPYEDPNYSTKWRFDGFCIAGERGGGKQLVRYFNPLPQAAQYFNDLKDLLYDPGRKLIADYTHILKDNIARLPIEFIIRQSYSDPIAVKLAKQVQAETDEKAQRKLLEELALYITSRPQLLSHLRYCLDEAIEMAIKQVRWNYKTALPLYYPTGNCMSLMLPLSLLGDGKPDVAFVVQLMESGNYQGQTILTLPQAYLDARLLCRPNSDWLSTDKTLNSIDLEDIEMDAIEME